MQADSASLATRHSVIALWAQPASLLSVIALGLSPHCYQCCIIAPRAVESADAMHWRSAATAKCNSKVQSGQVASMGVHARSRALYTMCAGMRRARAMQGTGSTGDAFIQQNHCQPDQLHRRCSRAVSVPVSQHHLSHWVCFSDQKCSFFSTGCRDFGDCRWTQGGISGRKMTSGRCLLSPDVVCSFTTEPNVWAPKLQRFACFQARFKQWSACFWTLWAPMG